jgi:hypothetical protein
MTLRVAAKTAIDTGDLTRARALLDLLDSKASSASFLTLARRPTNR